MGGRLSMIVRKENGEIQSFKVGTWMLGDFLQSPRLMEYNFIEKVINEHHLLDDDLKDEKEHDNYESNKAVKAPYMYGLILLDYQNKTILSANNYCSLITGSSAKLLTQYRQIIGGNCMLGVEDYKTKEVTHINLREESKHQFNEVHQIHYALKHQAKISIKGKEITECETIEDILYKIYQIDLREMPYKKQYEFLKNLEEKQLQKWRESKNDKDFIFTKMDDYEDIQFEYPDYTVINYASGRKVAPIKKYMKENGFVFTEYEKEYWKQYAKNK